jgi:hypothetical protein
MSIEKKNSNKDVHNALLDLYTFLKIDKIRIVRKFNNNQYSYFQTSSCLQINS